MIMLWLAISQTRWAENLGNVNLSLLAVPRKKSWGTALFRAVTYWVGLENWTSTSIWTVLERLSAKDVLL